MSRILAKKALPVGFGRAKPATADPVRFVNIYLDQACVAQYRYDPSQIEEPLSFGARPMMTPPT
jgi:hypothetical protein